MSLWSDFMAWLKPPAIKPTVVKPTSEPDPVQNPTIPQCGIDLLKKLEACKLTAYQDERGIWTIGYGHTKDVKQGDTCTQEQADAWLAGDCLWACQAIRSRVQVPLTANQNGALLSFVYNLGAPQFEKSSLLYVLNAGHYDYVPSKIKQWTFITLPDGTRKVSQGLVNRRNAEAALWIGSDLMQS